MSLVFSSENTPQISVKVNNENPYTGLNNVAVKVASSSEIAETSFAVGSNCSENWESDTTEKTVTLPNMEGEYTIAVRARNKEGFFSECTKSKIILDKTSPVVSDTQTLVSNRSLLTASPRLNVPVVTDALSGVDKLEIKLVKTTGNTIIKDWTEKPKDALYFDNLNLPDSEADSYYYIVRATDKVGNVSSEKSSPSFIAGPVVTINAPLFNQEQTMGYVSILLSRASPVSTTVLVKSSSGSALAGIDYLFPDIVPTEVTLTAGEVSKKTYYSIFTRMTPATNKSFGMQITSATNAAVGTSESTVTLTNTQAAVPATNGTGYKSLFGAAAGHMCAQRLDGKMDCWGGYSHRNGHTSGVSYPREVAGAENIRDVATGYGTHNCYINTSGDAYCFGRNDSRQLGDGSTTSSAVPIKLSGYSNIKKITVGVEFTCMIDSNDQVYCWGDNSESTIGQNKTTTNYSSPTLFSSITKAIDVTAGNKVACAIDEVTGTRTVKCWGLLDGVNSTHVPATVTGIPNDIQSISASGSPLADVRHGCGVTESGDVYCWGSNYRSRRGTASTSVAWDAANKVTLPVKALKVKVGTDSSCALGENGLLYCWGAGIPSSTNQYEFTESSTPVLFNAFGETITDFHLGETSSCAVTLSTQVKCWGFNRYGELGNGQVADFYRSVALTVGNFTDTYQQLATGLFSTCALRTNKTVSCWGSNDDGQLGTGTRNNLVRPSYTLPISNVTKVSGMHKHFCALTSAGDVYCWGSNMAGQIGNNATAGTPSAERVLTPYKIPQTYPNATAGLPTGIKDISAGYYHTCAVNSAGGVLCWGNNTTGEAGHSNTSTATSYPIAVSALTSGVESIATYIQNTCAVKKKDESTKEIYCWGTNTNGVVGAAIGNQWTPTLIDTISTTGTIKLSVGYEGACYLLNQEVKCWGLRSVNASIPLTGVADNVKTTTPTAVPELAGATSIHLAVFQGCATMAIGGVKCWGIDNSGLISYASQFHTSPTNAFALGYGIASTVSLGMNPTGSGTVHACSITSLGDLKCWGTGILGEGHDAFIRTTPLGVLK
ncbi:hypothetical protein [Bdellovibrio bacteriovorus]|uniref:hypothetical protein n=1 Tax=Bdellovibrio bacteriovorus TaxID=959 RepID=UPI001E3D9293|nr:hypothetical protein [Bdellovibrio bacteriovorus]